MLEQSFALPRQAIYADMTIDRELPPVRVESVSRLPLAYFRLLLPIPGVDHAHWPNTSPRLCPHHTPFFFCTVTPLEAGSMKEMHYDVVLFLVLGLEHASTPAPVGQTNRPSPRLVVPIKSEGSKKEGPRIATSWTG